MGVLNEIYAGWKNYIFPTEAIEKTAKERIRICVEECASLKNTKTCSICGCYMPAKARSVKSRCPLKKW